MFGTSSFDERILEDAVRRRSRRRSDARQERIDERLPNRRGQGSTREASEKGDAARVSPALRAR
jgi:hypothetical protein